MKFIKRSKSSKRNDPFSISISDLMAGILMIFILALISMFFMNKSENERNNHQVEQRKEIRKKKHGNPLIRLSLKDIQIMCSIMILVPIKIT